MWNGEALIFLCNDCFLPRSPELKLEDSMIDVLATKGFNCLWSILQGLDSTLSRFLPKIIQHIFFNNYYLLEWFHWKEVKRIYFKDLKDGLTAEGWTGRNGGKMWSGEWLMSCQDSGFIITYKIPPHFRIFLKKDHISTLPLTCFHVVT